MIIAVDIGASKVKVGTFATGPDGPLTLLAIARYKTQEWRGLAELLSSYLATTPVHSQARGRPAALVLGLAGPVTSQGVQHLTNLNWSVDPAALHELTDGSEVYWINDLVAHAYGALSLGPEGLLTLQKGARAPSHRAIIAAGSGLGQCLLLSQGGTYWPLASEGGHHSFAPNSSLEIRLLEFLRERYPEHVSWERVVSGKFGFRNLADFYSSAHGQSLSCEFLQSTAGLSEPGAVITGLATQGDATAINVLRLFVSLYGSVAGNLALTALPLSDLYISGGIARRILPWLCEGGFMTAFLAKGRMKRLLQEVAVHVVTDAEAPLKGLAAYASQQLALKSRA